jgi:RHS repeat-associated protein
MRVTLLFRAAALPLTIFIIPGKRLDEETGLYYYGARYLNPQTSMWLSTDPAMGEYIPRAPINDEAKRYNGNLPGMGGVFNYVNLHVYHYAGNNPVKLVDPTGRSDVGFRKVLDSSYETSSGNGFQSSKINMTIVSNDYNRPRTIEISKNFTIHFDNSIAGQKAADDFKNEMNFQANQTIGNSAFVLGIVTGIKPGVFAKIAGILLTGFGVARDNFRIDYSVDVEAGDTMIYETMITQKYMGELRDGNPTTRERLAIYDKDHNLKFEYVNEF